MGFLWYLQESNQGHMDFQSIALPTELRYQWDANLIVFFILINFLIISPMQNIIINKKRSENESYS